MRLFSQIDEVAPIVHQPANSLEQNYRAADAKWKAAVSKLQKLEADCEKQKATATSDDYARIQDGIAFQKLQVEETHQAMRASLTILEKYQFEEGKKWQVQQKKERFEVLRAAILACGEELEEINRLEQSIPFKRQVILGKRQNLWSEFGVLQGELLNVNN